MTGAVTGGAAEPTGAQRLREPDECAPEPDGRLTRRFPARLHSAPRKGGAAVMVRRVVQAILRFDDGSFGVAAVCPAPLWSAVRVVSWELAGGHSAAQARASASGRLLDGLWALGADGLARPVGAIDLGAGLEARWKAPRGFDLFGSLVAAGPGALEKLFEEPPLH